MIIFGELLNGKAKGMTVDKVLLRCAAVSTLFFALGLAEMPYGFYTLLRIVLSGAAAVAIFFCYKCIKEHYLWGLASLVVLYNPIIPIHLGDKSVWVVLNGLTIFYFWLLFGITKNAKKHADDETRGRR